MGLGSRAAIVAAALALAFGGGAVHAKAHDMGVADGDRSPGERPGASERREGVGGTVSGLVKGGARGEAASGAGGGNRVEPVRPGRD